MAGETTPIQGESDPRGWRYGPFLVTLRLFINTATCIPTVTTAILPSLLDNIYKLHYACANSSHVTEISIQDDGPRINRTFQNGGCTYATKAFIIGSFVAYTPMIEIILTPTVPYVIQRVGVRWICIISTIVQIIGSTATGFTTNLWMLYIARYLHGFTLYSVVACFAAVGRKFEQYQERQQAVSIGLQGYLVCNLSYFFGTLIYDYFGLLPTYLSMSGVLVIQLIICSLVKDPEDRLDFPKNYSVFFRNFNVLLAILYGIFAWCLVSIWQSIYPDWLYSLGARLFHIGAIMTVSIVVQTIISMPYSRITFSNHLYGILSMMSFAILGYLSMSTTEGSYWLSILPSILILTAYCCIVASMSSAIDDGTEHNPLLNYNMFVFVGNTGNTLGGYSGGALAQILGPTTAFHVTGYVTTSLAVLLTFKLVFDGLRNRIRKYVESAHYSPS